MRLVSAVDKRAALIAVAVAASLLFHVAHGDANPNPRPFEVPCNEEDGDDAVCEETLKGNSEYVWKEDNTGHTVITNEKGEEVYAELDADGNLVPSDCKVHDCNPEKAGIETHLKDDEDKISEKCGPACDRPKNEPLNPVIKKAKDESRQQRDEAGEEGAEALRLLGKKQTVMYNLVLLMRYADHVDRDLPSEEDYGHLFNDEGGHPELAPGGSVKDCFTYNSYSQFSMESIIVPWCTLQHPESYYADGGHGLTGLTEVAIKECLDEARVWIDGNDDVDWADFNRDGDDFMDAIAVIHSGYGSECGGNDCETGNSFDNRIWSHKWEFLEYWEGTADGSTIKVNRYHISPGLWADANTCGNAIGRIGVICHETGHFLGLPDLYDGTGGSGVGTHCLMGNSWGWSADQNCPPPMSAWAKNQMGWLDVQEIVGSGTYELAASHSSNMVYAIVNPDNDQEFLLIENKGKSERFDSCLPQEGLLIWHIDEGSGYGEEGFPGQPGWPGNGEHYRVALVSADGEFNLEKGLDMGSADNYFHADGVNEFLESGVGKSGNKKSDHPNTAWYSNEQVVPSGIEIKDIGPAGPTMSFTVTHPGGGNAKTKNANLGKEEEKSGSCIKQNEDCSAAPSNCCSHPKMKCKQDKKGNMKCVVKEKRRKKKRNLRHKQA